MDPYKVFVAICILGWLVLFIYHCAAEWRLRRDQRDASKRGWIMREMKK